MHHIIPINAIIKVEPYWNVKVIFLDEDSRFEYIKVEPYWNVKIKLISGTIRTHQLK